MTTSFITFYSVVLLDQIPKTNSKCEQSSVDTHVVVFDTDPILDTA